MDWIELAGNGRGGELLWMR